MPVISIYGKKTIIPAASKWLPWKSYSGITLLYIAMMLKPH